ncbi:MAG: hypothetical protein LWW85_03555 [Marinilabiliales bacterium]|nr:hypothetical protein [Marinilabiliales bacterium]
MENNSIAEKDPMLNYQIKQDLLETSRWGKILALIGYVGLGAMVLFFLLMVIRVSFATAISRGLQMSALAFFYVIVVALYVFPITYLYRFSNQIRKAVLTDEEMLLTTAFHSLKKLFRFMGIMTLAILSLYALIVVIFVTRFLMKTV